MRKIRQGSIFTVVMLLFFSSALWAAEKPNILVIWGDDIGQSNISAYTHGVMGYQTSSEERSEGKECRSRCWR